MRISDWSSDVCSSDLPGERELAQALGVSRTTLTAAYGQLRENGYLLSRRGSGSVTHLPGGRDAAVEADDGKEGDSLIDWTAAALPAPASLWEAYEEALRRLPAWLSGIGYEAMGLTCLREAIARDYARRGCPTRPEQIIVTSGAQNGLRSEEHTSGLQSLMRHPYAVFCLKK